MIKDERIINKESFPQKFSRKQRILKREEFERIYRYGRKIEAEYIIAFLMRTENEAHRLGVTSTKKSSKLAVDRNRMKRVVRELFRANQVNLSNLNFKYDWVINTKRSLLAIGTPGGARDFEKIIKVVCDIEATS